MKKVIFGITSLQIGGAERVLVDIVNKICDKFDVTIFTIYDNGKLKNQVNSKVKIISLYSKRFEEFSIFQRIIISLKLAFIDKVPAGFDVYVAFLEGPITRLFAKNIKVGNKKLENMLPRPEKKQGITKSNKNNIKKIAWIHNDISKVFGSGMKSKIKKIFDKRIYKKYDKIIFVSKENQDDFNKTYGNNFNEKIIKNYIDYNRVIEKSNEDFENPYDNNLINFVTSCRLVEQKALDRFIKVHKKLESNGFHSKVYVLGEGPLDRKLREQTNDYNLNDSFIFLGAKTNPYPYIKKADYFCLFSYYEGYGMVLEEAKILNKKILITDTAAKESVENYENSRVFENSEKGIYDGLKEIIAGNNMNKPKVKEELTNTDQKLESMQNLRNQNKEQEKSNNTSHKKEINFEIDNKNNSKTAEEYYDRIIEGIVNIL